jgi:hypothetical protein
METTSNRWNKWMEPRFQEMAKLPREIPVPIPRPRYIFQIYGGWTMLDGEPIGLADLNFMDGISSFNIAVESAEEVLKLGTRITGCFGFGLVELEEDGEYHEWYDDNGNSIEELVDQVLEGGK